MLTTHIGELQFRTDILDKIKQEAHFSSHSAETNGLTAIKIWALSNKSLGHDKQLHILHYTLCEKKKKSAFMYSNYVQQSSS